MPAVKFERRAEKVSDHESAKELATMYGVILIGWLSGLLSTLATQLPHYYHLVNSILVTSLITSVKHGKSPT